MFLPPNDYSDKQNGELNWQIIMEQNNDRYSNRGTKLFRK